MLVFGIIGYVMRKTHFPMAPIALTLVLGRYFEQSLRQSLVLSQGDFSIFLRSPISTALVAVAAAMVVVLILRAFVTRYRGWQGRDSEV
jgi:putative tricarboxylic transport membrane protein